MTKEQKRQLDELLKLQKADERRERDKLRRDAERYVKERFGIDFKELQSLLDEHNERKIVYDYNTYE